MPTYRLTRGSLSLVQEDGTRKDYKVGDILTLPEKKAARMKRQLVRVEGDITPERVTENFIQQLPEKKNEGAENTSPPNLIQHLPNETPTTEPTTPTVVTSPKVTTSNDWSFVRERKATEVIELVKALDSRDDLLAVRAEEGKGETPRSGVLKAIQTRLSQLEGENQDD